MYPSWSFQLKDETGSETCMLKGKEMSADEAGVQVVIDYNPLNTLHCCKEGEVAALGSSPDHQDFLTYVAQHNINHTKIRYTIPEGKHHPQKDYFYEVAVPDSCLPGGAKAPCPLLVSLHGMAMDHISHMALECSECMQDMGVIAVMLYMPDAVTHDEAGQFVINTVWDSEMWIGEKYVRPVTQQILEEYSASIDTERVYIYGLSMGGAGALMDAITEADIFSAAFVVSPTSVVRKSEDMPSRADDQWKPLYSERKNVGKLKKIFIYQGGDDMNGEDIDWDLLPQTIKKAGVDEDSLYVEYRMFPKLPHDCWRAAFEKVYDLVWKGV